MDQTTPDHGEKTYLHIAPGRPPRAWSNEGETWPDEQDQDPPFKEKSVSSHDLFQLNRYVLIGAFAFLLFAAIMFVFNPNEATREVWVFATFAAFQIIMFIMGFKYGQSQKRRCDYA